MVKDGYKETEIGIIPEDWEVKKIEDIAIPKARIGWQNLRKEEYLTTGDYLLITGTDFSDGKVILGKCCYVSKERYAQDKNIQISNGAILITKDGTLGKVAIVESLDKPATLNAGVFVLNSLEDNVDNRFLYQYLRTDALLEYAFKTSTGGTIKHLNQNVLVNFRVPCPPKIEQQKIAEALSDMDNLISSLEKLIEKKKAIKQACLQKMFPRDGKTVPEMRLPGFNEPWEQRKVSELFKVTRGYVLATTLTGPAKTDEMPYPVYSSQTKGNGLMGYYNDYLYEDAITWTTDGANAGTVNYRAGKFYCTNVCGVLLSNEVTANQMIAEALNNVAKGYVSYVGNPKLMNNVMADIEIMIPTQAEEREKLSVFFHNLDRLITLHQRKLEKCRKIKEGMMQQLLTGKIRLISNADAVAENREVGTLRVSSRGHNRQFDDAVVIAGIVDKFYSDKYPLGRKKVQKLLYLFRRHQEADISAFKKKAAGPYADEVRYKGGEPIAISNKYICVKKSSKGSSFSKGEKIGDALTYLGNWNLNDDLKWLCERFKYTKTDRLELLATIDMAMCDLTDAGIDVTVENIKNLIKSHSEWKAKLSKDYFKNKDIAWAIKECRRLFG